MEDLIINTLNDVYQELINHKCKTTHTESYSEYIDDFTISKFKKFIVEKNIPDDAIISTVGSDYEDGNGYPIVYWNQEVPNSDDYKSTYVRAYFEENAFKAMSKVLLQNGYVSRNFPCKMQSTYAVYDWYMDKNWDELEHFYLIYFKKK